MTGVQTCALPIWDTVNSRKNYDEVIEIETDKLFSSDALGIIQLLILEYLARKEIVIEALPTSNLCISHYQHLKEYHLEKWLEVDQEKILLPSVVLGSDDPGIFMTNIYRWVLSIPFFISCIRQQNPLTVLSKIILRKVKQFNLPPQKK